MAGQNPVIVSAIERREILQFVYHGERRTVEPQTYGISRTGKEVLRACQTGGGSRAGELGVGKLFEVSKMTELRKTGGKFKKAHPGHNPKDSAMVEIFATLPAPKKRDQR
jgi:hypothetical protein